MANVLFTKTSNAEFVISNESNFQSDVLFIEPMSFDLTSDAVFLGNGDTPFVPGGIILNPIPCRNAINDCECIDSPFANFSAELPDQDRFLAVSYVFNPPPLNQFGVLGCKAWCWSEVSQAEAELCATAQATLCGPVPPFNPPGLFGNTAQTCDYTCPTGALSSYTVAANQVYESSQAAADALAFSIACIGAESNAHCIPTPQPPSDEDSGPTATAWWKMEEAFGNRMDSVYGMALVPVSIGFGSVSQVAGKVGSGVSCIRANDSSAYLTSGGYAALGFNSNGQTLLGWCKVQYPVHLGAVLTFGYFSINFDLLNNQVVINFDTQAFTASVPMIPDEWVFFAIYYDSVTGKMGANINGLTVTESTDSIFPDFQPNGFVSFSSGTNNVAASLDELAFYQVKLSTAQIAAIYNAGGGRTYPVTLPP